MAAARVEVRYAVVREAISDGSASVISVLFRSSAEAEAVAYREGIMAATLPPPAGVSYRFSVVRISEHELHARWIRSKVKALPPPS